MTAQPVVQGEPATVEGHRARAGSRLAVGTILIVVGMLAVIARAADVDVSTYIGEQTWPILVVLPGLILLSFAFLRTPPDGLGFVIAGSIVTTVGVILLVQANTDTWETWAYVWALIPGAAGLGMAVYGLLTRTMELVHNGTRLLVISGVLVLAGWWYFQTLFTTGEQPIDLGTWWPVAVIAIGVILAARALLGAHRSANTTTSSSIGGTTP